MSVVRSSPDIRSVPENPPAKWVEQTASYNGKLAGVLGAESLRGGAPNHPASPSAVARNKTPKHRQKPDPTSKLQHNPVQQVPLTCSYNVPRLGGDYKEYFRLRDSVLTRPTTKALGPTSRPQSKTKSTYVITANGAWILPTTPIGDAAHPHRRSAGQFDRRQALNSRKVQTCGVLPRLLNKPNKPACKRVNDVNRCRGTVRDDARKDVRLGDVIMESKMYPSTSMRLQPH